MFIINSSYIFYIFLFLLKDSIYLSIYFTHYSYTDYETITTKFIFFSSIMQSLRFNCSLGMLFIYMGNIGREFDTYNTFYNWKKSFNVYRFHIVFDFFIFIVNIIVTLSFFILKQPEYPLITYFFIYNIIIFTQIDFIIFVFCYFRNIIERNGNSIEMISINSTNSCCICLEENSDKEWVKIRCGHEYHRECIIIWSSYNRKCPICRVNF